MFSAVPARPEDLLSIERHPDQAMQLGLAGPMSYEDACHLCGDGVDGAWGEAWSCSWRGRLVAAFGLRITLGGSHAIGWAVVGNGIGAAHLAFTRFARSVVEGGRYGRIEAITLAADVELMIAQRGPFDAQQLIDIVMMRPTREIRFAQLLGLRASHVLRRYGASGETHMLMERIA